MLGGRKRRNEKATRAVEELYSFVSVASKSDDMFPTFLGEAFTTFALTLSLWTTYPEAINQPTRSKVAAS
jgi:hypothetical protein